MRESTGDLFSYPADATVIPVNWQTKRGDVAVMGAGVAKAAAERWLWLPAALGRIIAMHPRQPRVVPFQAAFVDRPLHYVVNMPTKRRWKAGSDPALIEQGVRALVTLADGAGWQRVVLPRLGCGLGALDWDRQVRPILAGLLDDRFVVVSLPDTEAASSAPQRPAARHTRPKAPEAAPSTPVTGMASATRVGEVL